MDIDDMKPGRELDALVAEKVMGWNPSITGNYPWQQVPPPKDMNMPDCMEVKLVPKFSTDIAAAWQVVEKFVELEYDFDFEVYHHAGVLGYVCSIEIWGKMKPNRAWHGDTAPHAICKTALRAVSVDDDGQASGVGGNDKGG